MFKGTCVFYIKKYPIILKIKIITKRKYYESRRIQLTCIYYISDNLGLA